MLLVRIFCLGTVLLYVFLKVYHFGERTRALTGHDTGYNKMSENGCH